MAQIRLNILNSLFLNYAKFACWRKQSRGDGETLADLLRSVPSIFAPVSLPHWNVSFTTVSSWNKTRERKLRKLSIVDAVCGAVLGREGLPVDREKSETSLKPASRRVPAIVFNYSSLFMNAGLRYSVNVLGTFLKTLSLIMLRVSFQGLLTGLKHDF